MCIRWVGHKVFTIYKLAAACSSAAFLNSTVLIAAVSAEPRGDWSTTVTSERGVVVDAAGGAAKPRAKPVVAGWHASTAPAAPAWSNDAAVSERAAAYCTARRAEARADAKILIAPSLKAGYRDDDEYGRSDNVNSKKQAWAGVEFTPSNIILARTLKARAEADCRMEAAHEGLVVIADEMTARSRLAAYQRKAAILAEKLGRARRTQERMNAAVNRGAATVEEKLSVDRAVTEMVNARAEAQRLAAVERAKLTGRVGDGFDRLIRDYVEAKGDAARADNALRRARAFTVSLIAEGYQNLDGKRPDGQQQQPTSSTDSPDMSGFRFGVRASYALGSLLIAEEERTIIEARKEDAVSRMRGVPQSFLALTRVIEAERTELRSVSSQLRTERTRAAQKIKELEHVSSERSQRIADATRLYVDIYDADIAYFETLNGEYDKLASFLSAATI